MKSLPILLCLAVMALAINVVNLHASWIPAKQYPKNFIPFWSQEKRGHETTLLNTNQIVRITPVFDPTVSEPNHSHITHLEVELTNGKTIEVFEDFRDFFTRVRVSQAK